MTITIPWPFARSISLTPPPASCMELSPNPVEPKLLLRHYTTPGVSPPSARIDPKLKIRQRRPIRLWHLWKYGLFAVTKATEVTTDVISHGIWGPRKKSWGIEMTVITSFMRGTGRHSGLVDIDILRTLMSLGGLVPLPSDALVTPVTFRVRKRQLRGILADFDAKETGSRELSGEWVVGRKTWLRLQSEWRAARQAQERSGSSSFPSKAGKVKEKVILYIHGGAYYLSSAASQRIVSIPLSKYADARVFALDYRLAPETRFPGPLHDAVSGYLRLVEDLHIPPENIVVAGDSAGGGLTLALLMYLRDNAYPLPAGAILMSPWVDLTMSCESWESNARFDVVPVPAPDDHMNPVSLYLGDHMERFLTHPYASPLFGDLRGLPPLLIQAGDAEVLRDEISLLAHKATLAGVDVRHELYEDAVHVFQSFPFLDASRRAFLSIREFVRTTLPGIQSHSPQLIDTKAEVELEHEIDNEQAKVVRGDGVETASGMEEVQHEFAPNGVDEIPSESGSDEDGRSRVYPSWGRSRNWTASAPSSDEESSDDGEDTEMDTDDDTETEQDSRSASSSTRHRRVTNARLRRRATMPSLNRLKRISSAISYIMPDPIPPFRPPRREVYHQHQRTASTSTPVSTPTTPPKPTHRRRNSTAGLAARRRQIPDSLKLPLAPAFSMTNMASPMPSPSIRRSSSSHPDIHSLVESWNHLGPANRTTFIKTSSQPP
ncbi:hypothetical protein HGRIS_008331 [Hohenbuehelia grisea]|uniref:Alpha/beta hydrolase fold-3 domain-containing protein n=1 Tax=Hohenbuehelia grisea TaxID=104357 RepID=A0ABR3J806_9AGAR